MQYIFDLNKFETRANRPLFTGDIDAYVLRIKLPQQISGGTITTASYRPGAKNPMLDTQSFSGDTCDIVLKTGQYDTVGETRILCSVTDNETGGILTTRVFYATVSAGLAEGTPAGDDYADLTEIIVKTASALSECKESAEEARQAAESASAAAEAIENIPVKSGTGEKSAEIGAESTKAVGDYSLALGYDKDGISTEARGNATVALGKGNRAYGKYSAALGCRSETGAEDFTNLPKNPDGGADFKWGANAFAAGYSNKAVGESSAAMGENNKADGKCSVALGGANKAYSYGSAAVGFGNVAGDETDTYRGHFNGEHSPGLGAFCAGVGNTARKLAQAVFGKYNAHDDNALFIIGNGESGAKRSNAMVVKQNGDASFAGKVTVGTPTAGSHAATKSYVDNSKPISAGAGAKSLAGGNVLPEKITGADSFAYGDNENEISSNYCAAFGQHNTLSGMDSFSAGSWNTVISKYSAAFGEGNSVSVTHGAAFGNATAATNTDSQLVCGKYNARTDGLFIVGNGTSYSNLSNALVVKENGDAALSGKLTVNSVSVGNTFTITATTTDGITDTIINSAATSGDTLSILGYQLNLDAGYMYIGSNTNQVHISNLSEPSNNNDAATKGYVDSASGYATQTKKGTLRAWTSVENGETVLYLATEDEAEAVVAAAALEQNTESDESVTESYESEVETDEDIV